MCHCAMIAWATVDDKRAERDPEEAEAEVRVLLQHKFAVPYACLDCGDVCGRQARRLDLMAALNGHAQHIADADRLKRNLRSLRQPELERVLAHDALGQLDGLLHDLVIVYVGHLAVREMHPEVPPDLRGCVVQI